MELGNILGKFKPAEKEVPKKFLALVLTDEVVQAAVWHVVEGQTEILALGTPVEWDGDTGTTAQLVTAADATISSATEGLNDEPAGIILGIPHSWTDKSGILGSKRELIKNICKELELKPLGFVEITDSILSYLKMQEGTPATSILIQVSRDELTLVLVRLGRIEGIETIGRSDDVVEDTTEGIARFAGTDNLPSRIILFNSMHNLDEITQNLLSVDWQTQFNFLHIPKVETLPKDVAIRALAVAGGSEVAKSLGFVVSQPVADGTTTPVESVAPEKVVELVSAQEIGFSFAEEPAITEPFLPVEKEEDEVLQSEEREVEEEEVPMKKHVPKNMTLPNIHLPAFTFSKPKMPQLPHWSGGKKQVWIGILACLAVVAALGVLIWMVPKATVTIQVAPKDLEQQVSLTLSTTTASVDTGNAIVPATLEATSTSGDKTVDTTGSKTIGNPAKGDLTIYNRTSLTKTFTKGSSIAAGNLKFTLDGDVTVASQSAGSDYVAIPGKATIGITANTIGEESNLASGTEFTILNFGKDSYVGKNEVALGGGSSEQIQVVGKDDLKNLAKSLTAELLSTLASNASSGSVPGTGMYLIPSSAKLTTESYSAKVGDKATSVTANFTLSASILHYQTQDVTTLINSLIDQSIPAGYIRSNLPSTVDLTADTISENGDTVKGTANVKVSLLPAVNLGELASNLKGKSSGDMESSLKNQVPGFQSATAAITPLWLPPRFKSMPYNAGNIVITLTPETP